LFSINAGEHQVNSMYRKDILPFMNNVFLKRAVVEKKSFQKLFSV